MECKEEKLEKREEVTVQIGDLHIKVKENKRRKSREEGRSEEVKEVKDSERDNFDQRGIYKEGGLVGEIVEGEEDEEEGGEGEDGEYGGGGVWVKWEGLVKRHLKNTS